MGVLDVPRRPIANPFANDSAAAAFFATLDEVSEDPVDLKALFLGDSTGNQQEEWWGLGWTGAIGLWPEWRVLYYPFNDGGLTWSPPVTLQAGLPVGDPVPVNGVVASDSFTRTDSELNGDTPTQGQPWSTTTGYYATNGTKAYQVGNATGLATAKLPYLATGDVTATCVMGIANNEGASKQHRLHIKWLDDSNLLRLNFVGSTTKTITIIKIIGGTSTTIATLTAGAIPNNAAQADYNISFSCVGTAVSATVNGVTASATITEADAAALANASAFGWGSNSTTATLDTVSVSVNGISTDGPYRTLHLYNGSVPGTTLDYQTSDANAARRTVLLSSDPDVVFLSGGHNYDADTPSVFLGKVDSAVAEILANVPGGAPDIVISSQNPKFEGTSTTLADVANHRARQLVIRQHAMAEGWGYVPGYEVFASRKDGGKHLIDPDGTHPKYTGSLVQGNGSMCWGDVLTQYLRNKSSLA